MRLLLGSTATLCELALLATLASHKFVVAMMMPSTGPLGISLAAT